MRPWSRLCGAKSLNRLEHIRARRRAREAGVDEAQQFLDVVLAWAERSHPALVAGV